MLFRSSLHTPLCPVFLSFSLISHLLFLLFTMHSLTPSNHLPTPQSHPHLQPISNLASPLYHYPLPVNHPYPYHPVFYLPNQHLFPRVDFRPLPVLRLHHTLPLPSYPLRHVLHLRHFLTLHVYYILVFTVYLITNHLLTFLKYNGPSPTPIGVRKTEERRPSPPEYPSILYLFNSIQLRPCNHQSFILPAHTIPSCHFTSCLPISYLSYPRGFYVITFYKTYPLTSFSIYHTTSYADMSRDSYRLTCPFQRFSPIRFMKHIGPLILSSAFPDMFCETYRPISAFQCFSPIRLAKHIGPSHFGSMCPFQHMGAYYARTLLVP